MQNALIGIAVSPARSTLSLAEVERTHILDTLTYCHGNRTQTAKFLGISLRGLRIKLYNYNHSGYVVCGSAKVL